MLPTLIVSLGPVLAGICLSGLWAADVSTAVSLLLGVSTILTKDIVLAHVRPGLTDRQQLVLSKVFLTATVILGLLLAMSLESIVTFLMSLHTLFAPFTIVVLAALFAPKIMRKSTCMATMLVGIAAMLAWLFIPATHIVSQAVYLVVPVCVIAFVICLIVDKRPVDVSALHVAPGKEEDPPDAAPPEAS